MDTLMNREFEAAFLGACLVNVTYLSLEDSKELVKDRLDLISPDTKPANLFTIYDIDETKFDAAGLKRIAADLDETGSELLIVDTWKHVAPNSDDKRGTSYEIDYESF